MVAQGSSELTHKDDKDERIGLRVDGFQQDSAAVRQSLLTLFPSSTGRRTSAGKRILTIETYSSSLTISSLQEVAQRYYASPTAALQTAWAKLLDVYTGAKDNITFRCILPRECDNNNTSHSSSPIFCSFNAQEQGQVATGCVVRYFHESTRNYRLQDERLSITGEGQDNRLLNSTLLDLEDLSPRPRHYKGPEGKRHHRFKDTAAARIEVSSSAIGTLSLTVSAYAELLDKDGAQLMLAQYDRILEFVTSDPDSLLNEVCTHFPPRLLSMSNTEPTVPYSFCSLQSQFECFAKREPQRIALEFWNHRQQESLQTHIVWTFAELNHRAETLAAALQDRFGSLVDQIVPVCMDRCPEIYVAVLGILKAGAAWSPVDPSFPPRRRHDLIVRAGARALVVNAHSHQDGIPEHIVVVDMARIDWRHLKRPKEAPISSESLAYLIWTSGTTGPPKGVPISHQAAVASMTALQARIPTDVKQGKVRCLQFSQFTFDVFVQDLFYTWGIGGTLISADRSTMLGRFSQLSTKAGATHAHLTPAFAASVDRKSCPTLEVVTMIGEKLTQSVADDWSEDCRLYNTYGPAETTVVSTVRHVPHKDTMQSANIGLPLPSVSAFVLQDGGLVMRNGIGELALGGPQLSKGYWHDAEKTRECFVWNERLQSVLYMTGDTVRQLYDGSFEFIGRTDDLVKIQGIRVELSEIAFVLRCSHPQVQHTEVLFLDRPDRPSKVIVAFLAAPALNAASCGIIEDDRAVELARKAVDVARTQLPEYMIPKVFLVVGAVPRTSSAKVDRAAIKQLYADVDLGVWEGKLDPTGSDDHVAADFTSQEVTIIETVAELTGTLSNTISRQRLLPPIGVDSIIAARLAAKLSAHGIAMSVTDILGCSTLDDLFRCSCEERTEAARKTFDLSAFHHDYYGSLDPDLVERVELVMPALPLQESLLSESFRNPSSYWSHNFFALDRKLDLPKLEQAWKHLVQGTDALRTAFYPVAYISGKPPLSMTFLQVIHRDTRIDWATLSASESDFEAKARRRAQEIAEQRQNGRLIDPLWAVTIILLESRAIMMVSTHHAVRDELSLDFILADLKNTYLDNPARPVQRRRQLRDAVSLLNPPDANRLEQDEKFWTTHLSPFTAGEDSKSWPELKLSEHERSGGTITHCWNADESYSDLRTRAASIGAVSLAAILRVVWGCILLEYLETDRIVFGQTWSARGEAPALSDVIGPLVFVIPIPFQAQGSLREILRCHTDFQMQSKAHYGVHPRQLRKMLRRSEMEALYPAIFNFMPDAAEQRHNDDLSLWQRIDDIVELNVEHAVALNAFVSKDKILQFELTGAKQWIDQEHLRILAQQIDALLHSTLGNPDMHLTQLSSSIPPNLLSLSPPEKDTNVNLVWAQTPTEWIDRNASLHPHWPAVEVASFLDENSVTTEQWSYKQLQRAYQNVAALISEYEYTKRMIAVCLDRRLDMYAVVLAIMSTGNTYLPIADDLPKERKSFLLQDSDAALLFTTKQLGSSFSPTCHTLFVEEMDYSKPIRMTRGTSPRPTDGAYLLYTSGSTGTPKGVLVSRGNLMSFIEAISHFICSYINIISLQGKGKWLGMASYAFDVHLLEMFFAWRHGMASVTAPRSMLLDNLELALQQLRITHASFVPSLVDNAGLNPKNLPDLRYMSLGGEKISKKAIDTWSRSHVVLANAYGPTEVTIGCCFTRVGPGTNVRNIGSPLAYTVAHVLRPGTTQYVLRGASGELCLTGDLVANGYHKRPDAKGFVRDFKGEKLYRTGDMVRLMADGSLEFLGRDDDQTKIRGQRIELGEVSEAVRSAVAVILGVDFVEVTCLVVQHPAFARPQLVAFIAAQENLRNSPTDDSSIISFTRDETIEEIRAHCRHILPSFMVPEHLIRLTSLPLVPTSRKVNIKHLRAIFIETPLDDLTSLSQPTPSSTDVTSEAERTVRGVIADILAVDQERIDADSSLFRLGLDSLNVISLALKLQKLGFDSSVSKILNSPTIKDIALRPSQRIENGGIISHPPKRIADLERKFIAKYRNSLNISNLAMIRPCLPLQETLVASSLDREGETLYVNHIILQLSPEVDHQKLVQAWMMTAEDHDILRTCFREFENDFVQLVLRQSPLSIDDIDRSAADFGLSSLRERQSDISLEIVANIGSKPPIRLTLAAPYAEGQNGMLQVSLHHALYDAESFSMILDEVYARYQTTTLPEVRTPFTVLINHVDRQSQEDSKAFWTRYLRDYSSKLFALPAADDQSRSMSRDLVTPLAEVDRIAASLNGTSASVMQALFGIVLGETLGTDDLVFGTVLSGRTIPVNNAHSILAPCITTIPQRVQIDHQSSFHNIVQSAQKGFVESIEYQHTALRAIHRWIGAESPLFDSLFTYTRKHGEGRWSHLWCEFESSMPSDFPLAVEVVEDQSTNRLISRCDFTASFGPVEKAASLLERLGSLTQSLAKGKAITLKKPLPEESEVRSPRELRESSWTQEETILKEIIVDMVGIDPGNVTKNTSFFTLGVDSIIAIQFARQARQHGLQCSSADVMRYSCVRKLAQHIALTRALGPAANGSMDHLKNSSIPFKDSDNNAPITYPCTPLQSGMLTQTLGSDNSVYVHHHAIRLSAQHDTSKVRKVWEKIVAGTEILRTSYHFSENTSMWSGVVHKNLAMAWKEWDSSIDIKQAVLQIKKRFVFREESDFARPPWAVNIMGDVFMLSLHHSLYDGESMRILFHDFWALLDGSQLPTRPPFSRAAEEIHKSSKEAESFWARSLDGFKGDTLRSSTGKSQEARTTLKADLASVLEGCRSLGVSLQSLVLLTFGKTLAWLSRQHDVAFGHVVRGRNLPALEGDDVVGPLFNTIPMRVNLEKTAATNRDAAQSIQLLTGESQAYQHASLNKMQQTWRKTVGNTDAELFHTLFVFQQHFAAQEDQLWTSVAIDDKSPPTEHSTNFECEQRHNEINICVNSSSIEDLDTFLRTFEYLLCDTFQCPDSPVTAVLDSLPMPSSNMSGHTNVDNSQAQSDANITQDTLGTVRRLLARASGISAETISEDASIFSLGLDSISAIQIAAAARKEGLKLSVADILQGRTARGICQRLDQSNETAAGINRKRSTVATEPNDELPHTPLSSNISDDTRLKALELAGVRENAVEEVSACLPGQCYQLLTWLKSGRTLGEGTWTYLSREILDVQRLLCAWRGLRERHPLLRTLFISTTKRKVVQIVLKPAAIRSDAFQAIDLTAGRHNAIGQTVKQEASGRFDLFAPPAELILVRGQEPHYVVLKLHHALYDAWTIPKLIQDLILLYEGGSLPPIPGTSSLIKNILHHASAASPQDYWRKSLAGCQKTILRSTHRAPQAAATTRYYLFTTSTVHDLCRLESKCQRFDTSLPTAVLIAFARTLAQFTGVSSPVFSLYQSGRSSPAEGLGETCLLPCLNVLPLIVREVMTRDAKTNIEELQFDLTARVPYEQSYLHDVFDWIGWGQEPLFNTFVNILWGTEASLETDNKSHNTLLVPWRRDGNVDDHDDIVPSYRLPGKTAVDGLDTNLLADANLYLDVQRCPNEDSLRLVVRCDYQVLSEEEAKAFLEQMGELITKFAKDIEVHG
ncbi:MAG: hypothetical protein Q9225_000364 [Loekoesia sp. 1 TL-2023]